jgi:trehalose 6-phosphate phosphatase
MLEHKGASLALHYRRAPRLGGYAHRLVRSLAPGLGPRFRIQAGKRVVEVRPAGRDKGAAVLEFMREPPFRGRAAVFIGDDIADEHGFTAVNRLGGVSIKVGPGRTAAQWRLRNVAAVWAWLASGWGGLR